jgi:hypothetical protein
MEYNEITNGLKQLGFNTGWVVTGNEITLWENSESQPTEEQITKAAKLWDQNLIAAKEAAHAKLAALGLTPDDLKALGL